jgi:Transglycosylase SLT domain
MRARAMALQRASERVQRVPARFGDECLAPRGPGSRDRASFMPVAVRSLFVCAGTGAILALALAGLRGEFEPVTRAEAATPSEVRAFLKPRVSAFVPPMERPAQDHIAAAIVAALPPSALIDRVPSDFLFPDSLTAVPEAPAAATEERALNPDDILEFGPMRIRRHLVETIMKAARATETDPILLMAIADKESSFSTAVKAKTSSATGLYQFIESTWLKVVRDFGAKHGLEKEAKAINWVDDELTVADAAERARILELRRDPYLSALLAAEMLKRDRTRIAKRIGRDLSDGETYLAHFLGPDDAERFLEKVVGQPKAAAVKLLPRPARANRSIFFARAGRKLKGLSVAEVHGKFEKMMGLRLDRYRNVHQVATAAVATTAVGSEAATETSAQ